MTIGTLSELLGTTSEDTILFLEKHIAKAGSPYRIDLADSCLQHVPDTFAYKQIFHKLVNSLYSMNRNFIQEYSTAN